VLRSSVNPLARILDANLNRAREALRVMEDVARFTLNDALLSERLKSLRHRLREALVPIDRGLLLAWRDTEGDVGTAIEALGEYGRDGVRGVTFAAGSRLTEALRTIEEAAKGLGHTTVAREVEAIRYAAYTAESELGLALGSSARRQWRLCVLITESLCKYHPWDRVAQEAIGGGADCLQLREKTLESGELVRRARRLVELARGRGVSVIVNDRPDVALAAGADGVHLGQEDMSTEDVRRLAGFGLIIGVSTENMEQALRAVREGADYCGVGPMFATQTKMKPRLAGPAYLREYLSECTTPHLAIGGIGPANITELVQAGCRGVAVSSCVCAAEDPRGVCEALQVALAHGAKNEGPPLTQRAR
jgi:thiamine-phosphate pyrophosphorylase